MDKLVVIFSMKSCPFCHMMKEMLDKENIPYVDRDIHEHEDEYQMFVDATGNEFVPSFMLIEDYESENSNTHLFAPERDFNEIQDGVQIIKEFLNY